MTGRRRNTMLAILFGYASLIIALARNVLFVPIYLRHIPLPEYGAWLATGGALALILVSDFGLSGVVTQKISRCYGAGDREGLGSLTGSALAIGCLMALFLTAISIACVPLLPGLLTLDESEKQKVIHCFLIAIYANALGLVGATIASVIRSLQKAAIAGWVTLAADAANVIVLLVGLHRGDGLYAIAHGMLARSAVLVVTGAAALIVVCARAVPMTIDVRWYRVRDLLGDSSRFFLSSIAMKVQSQANVVFVNGILGPSAAAIYGLTVRAHETVLMLLGQFNASLVPSMTHLFGSGNLTRFRAILLRILLSIAAVTALLLSITVILNSGFLRLWLANQSISGQGISILMAVALFTSSLGYVAYDALIAQGKFNFVSKVFLLSSLLQLLLLAAFLEVGAWFAPAALLLAAFVWGSLFWKRLGKEIGVTPAEAHGLLVELTRIVAVSAVTAAAFLIFYPTASSWWGLIGEGLLALTCLACGYLAFSAAIRHVAREEIGMTVRALRPT